MRGNWVLSAAITVGLGMFFLALARELGRDEKGEPPVPRMSDEDLWSAATNRLNEGKFGRASEYAREYVSRLPEDGVAWARLAWMLELSQRESDAEEAWANASRLLEAEDEAGGIDSIEEWTYLGCARLRRGDDRRASRAFALATGLLAQVETAQIRHDHAMLAELVRNGWERLGERDWERMAAVQAVRGITPFGETAPIELTYRALGLRLRALGDEQGARRALSVALSRAEGKFAMRATADNAYAVAALRGLLGDRDGAMRAWEEAVRLGFSNPRQARSDEDLSILRGEERFEVGLRAMEAAQAERRGSGG